MKLTIIVPVYNEEKTLAQVIDMVLDVKLENIEKEIIIVNDGSTDSTNEVAEEVKKKHPTVIYISQPSNQGKGRAIVAALKKATGEYVLIQDADLEYHPEDIKKLLKPLSAEKNLVVFGTRLDRLPNFKKDERTPRFFIQYLGNKFLSLLASILYGKWITDMETGYKLFPLNALEGVTLKAKSFDFEPEITARLLKAGYKIVEIPISTNPRSEDEGKKLNAFHDGPIALWTLLKYRFIN